MVTLPLISPRRAQRGTTMIEVLVTVVVLAVGLLGLAGLQSRMQLSEMESYQRAQALLLLDDMANRIATNRNSAASYVTGTANPLGADMTCPTTTGTEKEKDFSEWCRALQGAGEASGVNRVGAMVGGRGCVEDLGGGAYLVTVAWQGMTPIFAPKDSVACGKNSYDGVSGSQCANDLCRRALTTIVRIATL